jgi:hypothetical protein
VFDAHSRNWRIVSLAVVALATLAIVATYAVFNNMYDEPAHIAAGMEWLSRGTYTYEPQHPPLSRVAAAIGPWLAGERTHGEAMMYEEGRRILGGGAHYRRMLALARLGELPFFFVLAFVTWCWTRRVSDERTAALATLFVAANPNVLAHAGVAGTDIGPAAMMPAALLVWTLWLEAPTLRRSVLAGAVIAICGLTKFSAIAYWIPAAFLVALLWGWRARKSATRPRFATYARPVLLLLLVGALVTWATYRFSVGRVGGVPLPAPEFWTGLRDFFRHGTGGHPAFLLGHVRMTGWWYYDIVALGVKTPIPLLVFGAIGCVLLLRGDWTIERIAPVAGMAAVVLLASLTPVDIGVRLDLPFYPLLAVVAALGCSYAWAHAQRKSNRFLVAALCGWLVTDTALATPNYIAYFNVFAGPHPEHVLVDSNLDWGQDLYRLRDAVEQLHIDSLRIHYFGTAEFVSVGLPRTRRLRPNERATGWVAASETFYAGVWSDTALNWLHAYQPVGWVGRSIRLYYIKPAATP